MALDRHHVALASSSVALDHHHVALASSSVALDRHHVALASSSVALDRHHVALASSSVALDCHYAALAQSSVALGAKVSQPLVAEQHQPKRKRTQTGTRVQLAGQRLSCSVSMRGELMARLQQAGEGESRKLVRKAVGTCCATSC